VIDSGFRNAWFVPLTNTTNQQIIISKKVTETTKDDRTIWYPYSKAICQTLLVPVPQAIVREIPYEELQKIESERGMGSLGSSNK
jgi:dUTP pyrophosphatase